jgi:cardiolipin synthase A/B
MVSAGTEPQYQWLRNGREYLGALVAAIDQAKESVCLETYIFAAGTPGERVRSALVRAQQRGAAVQVLVDAFGSYSLPTTFWTPLVAVGGSVRQFNPLSLYRLGIRNHRKLLVCDRRVALIGGFNIAPEYDGDGITVGWCDLGLKVGGPLVQPLAASFHDMFARADMKHKLFARLRGTGTNKAIASSHGQLLLSGPGRGLSPIKRALHRDLARASSVEILVAYFLPPWRIRRQMARICRRGGRVQLLLAGKSDVTVAQLAAHSLYERMLRNGLEIFEYQPQNLHAKLFIIDDIVYAGSANLDQRSLSLNYELMLRIEDADLARTARQIFRDAQAHCRQVRLDEWNRSCSLWRRFRQHWSYFLLVRIDPYIVRRQWRAIPD